MLTEICGAVLLAVFIGILVLAYHIHMRSIYRDISHDEATELADEMFDDYCNHAEIRVRQKLLIIDEMKGNTL